MQALWLPPLRTISWAGHVHRRARLARPGAADLLRDYAGRFGRGDDATLVIHGGAAADVAPVAAALGDASPEMVLVEHVEAAQLEPRVDAVLSSELAHGALAGLPWLGACRPANAVRPAHARRPPGPPVHLQSLRDGGGRRDTGLAARHGDVSGLRLGRALPRPRRPGRTRALREHRPALRPPRAARPGRRRHERPAAAGGPARPPDALREHLLPLRAAPRRLRAGRARRALRPRRLQRGARARPAADRARVHRPLRPAAARRPARLQRPVPRRRRDGRALPRPARLRHRRARRGARAAQHDP